MHPEAWRFLAREVGMGVPWGGHPMTRPPLGHEGLGLTAEPLLLSGHICVYKTVYEITSTGLGAQFRGVSIQGFCVWHFAGYRKTFFEFPLEHF